MDILAPLGLPARLLLLLAGLLMPGAALSRAARVPCTIGTCFAGSAVALYGTVLALQLTSIRISLGSLSSGLGVIVVLGLVIGGIRGGNSDVPGSDSSLRADARLRAWWAKNGGVWLAPYALFWLIVLWRAWREPLAGPDVEFRWGFLAEQMLRIGSLDFYPPQAARDFLSYFWAESIPPGIAALHAWAFGCAGGAGAAWTFPATLLQIIALHELLWRTASHVAGPRAGAYASIAAAACPFLTWSTLLGQETGFTTLALLGILWALQGWHRTRTAGWAAFVGVFAVFGASAREYGGVFPIIAGMALLVLRADGRAWLAFLVVTALALVWPLRVWSLTGNPVYSLAVNGLPRNPRFIAWIEHDAAALGAPLRTWAGWSEILRYLALFAFGGCAGWMILLVGTARRNKPAVALLLAVGLIFALWLASVRYTNGGLFYSMRVLSPALAVGTLVVGIACAGGQWGAGPALAILLLLTLPATLALPQSPFRKSWREWPAFASPPTSPAPDKTVALLLRRRSVGTVLADSPGYQRRFLPHGVPVVALWSPQADWLFDRSLPAPEAIRRWRESGVRYLIIAKWQRNLDFFNTHSRWNEPPFQVQMIGETPHDAVFAISARD